MPAAKKTTDHREIQRWVESHGGHPATVKRTRGKNDVGLIRIDFPGFSGEGSLEAISWDEWFSKFDEQGLALLYQEGKNTNFNKLVRRDPDEVRPSDVKSGRARTARGGRVGRAAAARGRRNASQSGASSSARSTKRASDGGSSRSTSSSSGSRRARTGAGRSSTRGASSTSSRNAATRDASSRSTATRASSGAARGGTSSRASSTAASKRAQASTRRNRVPSRTSARRSSTRQMQDMTRAELYKEARSAGIPNRSHMSKDQLLRALERRA